MEPLNFENVGKVPFAGGRKGQVAATQICPETLSLIIQYRLLNLNYDDAPAPVCTWAAYLLILVHLFTGEGREVYFVPEDNCVKGLISRALDIPTYKLTDSYEDMTFTQRAISYMTEREKMSFMTMAETLHGLGFVNDERTEYGDTARKDTQKKSRYAIMFEILIKLNLIVLVEAPKDYEPGTIGFESMASNLPLEAFEPGL